jgi:hypothetical protein
MKTTQLTLLAICFLLLSVSGFSQNDKSASTISGYCDHIVGTISAVQYDSLVAVLTSRFPKSVAPLADKSKLFILPSSTFPYAELWNSATSLYTGSQVAFGSKEADASKKSQAYYEQTGTAYGDLLTVGQEGASGHPYGGNFFVNYGSMNLSNPNQEIEIIKLKEIRTIAPKSRNHLMSDYKFFGFTIQEQADAFDVTDSNGAIIKTKMVEGTPEAVLAGGIGHVSLHFELSQPVAQAEEISIGDMKVICEGNQLTIVLLSKPYSVWE